MPEFTVDFEVFCSCGEGLCNTSKGGNSPRRNIPFVTVEPCMNCLNDAIEKSFNDGYERAQNDAEKDN